jgi:hypothetical protein
MALQSFTTWDDPALWDAVRDLVTSKQRNAFLHAAEAQAISANAGVGQGIDITSQLNQNGIPTANAKVLVTVDLLGHSVSIHVKNAGVNWHGTLNVNLTTD